MFFYERQACIEFIDCNNVTITTPFRQRDFDLQKLQTEDRLYIDLIDLKAAPTSKNMKFYAFLDDIHDSQMEIRWVLDLTAHKTEIGAVEFLDGFKVFKVKILE